MRRRTRSAALMGLLFLIVPGMQPVGAQETLYNSTITGTVNDESGAALPGVTVEVTSPAVQGSRVARTEPDGSYRVSNLPAGIYRIAYTLTGFRTEVRNEFPLRGAFTARVDVSLKIGAIEETVQVSGIAPIVDLSTAVSSTTLTSATLQAIPSTRSENAAVFMAPGIRPSYTPDVGGSQMGQAQTIYSYGVSGNMTARVEGVDTFKGGSNLGYYADYDSLEEVNVRAMGGDADEATPGMNVQAILRSGGNDYHGSGKFAGEDERFEPSGGAANNHQIYYWDVQGDVGGRLKRDKWWFYGGVHDAKRKPTVLGYVGPDGKQGYDENNLQNYSMKSTYQVSSSLRLIGVFSRFHLRRPQRFGSNFVPYETTVTLDYGADVVKGEANWSPSPRLLVDVNVGFFRRPFNYFNQPGKDVTGNPNRLNLVTTAQAGAANPGDRADIGYNSSRPDMAGTVNYYPEREFLGGKHGLQMGFNLTRRLETREYSAHDNGQYRLIFNTVAGVADQPYQIQTFNIPLYADARVTHPAFYVKDNWQIGRRMTLNVGFRFDRYHSFYDEVTQAAGKFVDETKFPGQELLAWNKVVPRLGVAYDLTGNGKTVLRASFGKYGFELLGEDALAFNPATLTTTTYSWNGPCVVTSFTACDAAPATLAGLRPTSPNFVSQTGGVSLQSNPNLNQPVMNTTTLGLEHEIINNLGVRGMILHNRQVANYGPVFPLRPSSAYSIPVSVRDSQTGNAVTLYTYPASMQGAAFNTQQWENSPNDNWWNAFELTVTKRKAKRWTGMVSYSWVANHKWIAANQTNPNLDIFPLDTSFDRYGKGLLTYDAPWGINLATMFTTVKGQAQARTLRFTGVPQLGTVTVRAEELGAQYNPTISVFNFRVGKVFRMGGSKSIETSLDLFNVFNSQVATTISYLTGPTYGTISAKVPVMEPRFNLFYRF